MRQQALVSTATYTLTTLVGIVAFLYPFWLPAVARSTGGIRRTPATAR